MVNDWVHLTHTSHTHAMSVDFKARTSRSLIPHPCCGVCVHRRALHAPACHTPALERRTFSGTLSTANNRVQKVKGRDSELISKPEWQSWSLIGEDGRVQLPPSVLWPRQCYPSRLEVKVLLIVSSNLPIFCLTLCVPLFSQTVPGAEGSCTTLILLLSQYYIQLVV